MFLGSTALLLVQRPIDDELIYELDCRSVHEAFFDARSSRGSATPYWLIGELQEGPSEPVGTLTRWEVNPMSLEGEPMPFHT